MTPHLQEGYLSQEKTELMPGKYLETPRTHLLLENAGGNYIEFLNPATSSAGIFWSNNTSQNRAGITLNASDVLQFQTGGTANQMVILNDGNVGIGTDAPSSLLHVAGTTNDGDTLGQFIQTGTGRGLHVSRTVAAATRQMVAFTQLSATGGTTPVVHIQQADTGETALAISTDGSTENFTVSDVGEVYAAGSVGIGTTTPEEILNVDLPGCNARHFARPIFCDNR